MVKLKPIKRITPTIVSKVPVVEKKMCILNQLLGLRIVTSMIEIVRKITAVIIT